MVHTGHTTPSAVNLLVPPAGSFVPVFSRFPEQTPEKQRFVPEMGSFSEQTRGSTSGAWRASTPRRNSPAASLPTRCTAGRCPSSCTPAPPPSSAPRRIWPEAAQVQKLYVFPFSFSKAYEAGAVEEVADDFYGGEAGIFEYGSGFVGKFSIEFHHGTASGGQQL